MFQTSWISVYAVLGFVLVPGAARSAEKDERDISLSEGRIHLTAPEGWTRKQPRVRIIDHEFAVPAAEGDENDGRVTMMGAGGSVEANIDRWKGQFSGSDKSFSVDKSKIAGQEVYLVDFSGTYRDQRGPFAPAVMREDYRMLGAIIVTEKIGRYFVKFYGPQKTVDENEKKFKGLVESLKIKSDE